MCKYTKVAQRADIAPGQMIRVEVSGQPILLVNVDRHFYALCDTCPHEDASLSMGSLQGEYVRCPLHGSRFNVMTGEVQEEPAEEDLRVYPVRIEGEDVLIGPRSGR